MSVNARLICDYDWVESRKQRFAAKRCVWKVSNDRQIFRVIDIYHTWNTYIFLSSSTHLWERVLRRGEMLWYSDKAKYLAPRQYSVKKLSAEESAAISNIRLLPNGVFTYLWLAPLIKPRRYTYRTRLDSFTIFWSSGSSLPRRLTMSCQGFSRIAK